MLEIKKMDELNTPDLHIERIPVAKIPQPAIVLAPHLLGVTTTSATANEEVPHRIAPKLTRQQEIIQRAQKRRPEIVKTFIRHPPLKPKAAPIVTSKVTLAATQTTVVTPTTAPTAAATATVAVPPPLTLAMVKASIFRRLEGGKCAFTCAGRCDGVGSQTLGKISVRVMCAALGVPYVHQPFQVLEHGDNGIKPAVYVDTWEKLLSIRGGAHTLDRYPHTKHVECSNIPRSIPTQQLKDGWCYSFRDAHSFTNHFCDELEQHWGETIKELRSRTVANGVVFDRTRDKLASALPSPTMHVAVHIRRGDAANMSASIAAQRVLSNDYYADVMSKIKTAAEFASKSCVFHIVSEGTADDFTDLATIFKDCIEFHLSEPSENVQHKRVQPSGQRNQHLMQRGQRTTATVIKPKQTTTMNQTTTTSVDAFKMMVGADVLIMSKSAFSFLAGLYSSNGIKIVPPNNLFKTPQYCKKFDNWIDVDDITNVLFV